MNTFSIVIPTIGRPALGVLLDSLAACEGPLPEHVVVVDDRRSPHPPLALEVHGWPAGRLRVLDSDGRGTAAARNAGWRAVHSEWVALLDDDVVVSPEWLTAFGEDIVAAASDVAASQAPLTSADIAYRRCVLDQARGFDERFGRAFREDADLALRVTADGYRVVVGDRQTPPPARRSQWIARRGQHVATVAATGLAAVTLSRRRRTAASAAAACALLTGANLARGSLRYRGAPPWTAIAPPLHAPPMPVPIEAVLFGDGGALVRDEQSLERLRAVGVKVGVISSGSHAALAHAAPEHAAPELVRVAAADLDVPVERCAVIGDAGADVGAGLAAGAGVTILVPTSTTDPEDVTSAPLVFATLAEAVDELLINHTRRAPAA